MRCIRKIMGDVRAYTCEVEMEIVDAAYLTASWSDM
jgi:hypothetical protein